MLFLEVSLVAFLFQGKYANGGEALRRTFLISGLVIGLDLLLKAIYRFGLGVELFIDNNEHIQKFKWGLMGHPQALACGHLWDDILHEEDVNLGNVYYSEMKDAGFFDADWE
ncbi:unnamed protein product [Brassica oleracea var. botrytis]